MAKIIKTMKKIFFLLMLICLVVQPIDAKKRRGTTRTKAQLLQLLSVPNAWHMEDEDIIVSIDGYDNDGIYFYLDVVSGNRFRIEGPRHWAGPDYYREYVVLKIDSEKMVTKCVTFGNMVTVFTAEYYAFGVATRLSGIVTDPVDNYVNVRSGPGTKYRIVTTLTVGNEVFFEDSESSWLKVYNDDGSFMGWVYHDRIRRL